MNQGGHCSAPLNSSEGHIFRWNLPKMKLSTWCFEISQKKFHDVIMWFSIFLGQKLKTSYFWKDASYRNCSYSVGKHLPSSKRWLIIRMDILVSDREISVLNSNKISEKTKKSEFFVGGPKISIFKNRPIFHIMRRSICSAPIPPRQPRGQWKNVCDN